MNDFVECQEKFYLILSPGKYLTVVEGKAKVVAEFPSETKYANPSVREICNNWEITVDTLDKIALKYLYGGSLPPCSDRLNSKARPEARPGNIKIVRARLDNGKLYSPKEDLF